MSHLTVRVLQWFAHSVGRSTWKQLEIIRTEKIPNMYPVNVPKSFVAKKQVLKARLLSYRLLRCSTERRARGCRMLVHAVTIFEASRMSFFRADYWQMYFPDWADGE
ncbi:hypothetical protein XU18_4231 [Perkinsela sp. CCAP 1560/4]|nr:hypothetical protein XU18_4231 [Perkinsela sp. CCAP 1560/4]|eukprot:KNH04547.1 hypothetical protein XU18_4231 [Perkinsela sp. CCAP 1560/4]